MGMLVKTNDRLSTNQIAGILLPILYPRHTYSELAGIEQNQPEWRVFEIRATFGREFQIFIAFWFLE